MSRLPVRFISTVRAAVAAYTVLLALLGDRHYTYYPLAARTLAVLYLVYATAILFFRWRSSMRPAVVWALVGVDTGASTVLTGLTGGGESPVAPIVLLVLTAVAIRFGLRRAALALSWTVPLLVGLILLVPNPSRPGDQRLRDSLWWTAHLTAISVMAGVLSDRLDLAHRRRAQAEADAAVERQRLELERDLRRRLESLDEGRRAFLSSLLHEFRPSVASLSTLTRALRRDEELTATERAEMLERIDGYSHHLDVVLREVSEVLTSESLEAEHRLHQADIYLPQLVGEAAVLAGLAPDRVVTRAQPGGNVVRSDPDKCLRVLVKLLEEASRRSPAGGVIEVDIAGRDGLVALSVTPGGGGDASLGLWVATRLAEAMGGGLTALPGANGAGTIRATFGAQALKRTPG